MNAPTIWILAPFMGLNTWRCEWPAMELERRGYNVRFVDRDTPGGLRERLDYFLGPDDIVILHVSNMVSTGLARFVKHERDRVKYLFLQFDDDYFRHRDIQVDDAIRGHAKAVRDKDNNISFEPGETLNLDIIEGVRECDGVIAATEGVAQAYRKYAPWVEVVPNRMPERVSLMSALGRVRKTIVYLAILDPMGSRGVAPHYLDAMYVTGAIGNRHIHVIGGADGSEEVFANVSYTGRPLMPEVRYPRRPTGHLYKTLGGFRVAIAPLMDTGWNRAKSWIKPLEAATMGVPCVASPLPEYVRLRDAGVPVALASTPEEWQDHLDRFTSMRDGEWLRQSVELRRAAREQAIERHSEWSDLLERFL